jgi:toxin ParE1/3/4
VSRFTVSLASDAVADVVSVHRYVLQQQGRGPADHVRDELLATIRSLAKLPRRGHPPAELVRVGVHEFREVRWTRYRVVYEIVDEVVVVHAVFDGRRAVQDVLLERLLRG